MTEHALGRLAAPDANDHKYPMRRLVEVRSQRPRRYWNANGWWGDQGDNPWCVEYAWHHFVADGPVTHKPRRAPFWEIGSVYHEAQRQDEWDGEDYDGTSVRAGAKALKDLGLIDVYTWAFDADTVTEVVLEKGPVVVGTDWTDDMFEPDSKGVIHPTGPLAGGHAYLINGVNRDTGLFRIKNNWSREWGRRGHAYIPIEEMDALIKNYGEACLAVEIGPNDYRIKDMYSLE